MVKMDMPVPNKYYYKNTNVPFANLELELSLPDAVSEQISKLSINRIWSNPVIIGTSMREVFSKFNESLMLPGA